MPDVRNVVLDLLADICQINEVRENPDLDLFESGMLDSMGLVQLMVDIEEKLGVFVAITDFDRDEWSTANKIISFLERRV